MYESDRVFDKALLQNPPAENAPMYSWVWNSPITKERITEQLDEMQRTGVRGLYIIPEPKRFRPGVMETQMEPDYLTPEYFDLVRFVAEETKRRGMIFWLYDEGGWPSGSACGQVIDRIPDTAVKRIERRTVKLGAGETLDELPCLSVFRGEERVLLPHTAERDEELTVYEIFRPRDIWECLRTHVIREDAVTEFLRVTHEGYKSAMGDLFGSTVLAMFTDEPEVGWVYYWEDREAWEAETGWKLADMVPALYGSFRGEEGKRFAMDYIAQISKLFDERFLRRCADWCHANGLLFSGHMNHDDELHDYPCHVGYLLSHLRQLDIPGVDVIWRQLFPGYEYNRFFPRFASSAANQTGGNYALSESFAVYGEGTTFAQYRWVANYQAVRGINLLNLMDVPSGRTEFLSAQCRPHFSADRIEMRFFPTLNEYWNRLFYLMSIGRRVVRAALYVPERDAWLGEGEENFWAFGSRIESKQIDFDLVDDPFFDDVRLKDGKLCMGNAAYDTVFVPDCNRMPEKTKQRLSEFVAAGGRVIGQMGEIPADLAVVSCASPELRALCRSGDGFDVILLVNESEQAGTFDVTLPDRRRFVSRLDLLDGTITALPGRSISVQLESGEECVILLSDTAEGGAEPCFRQLLAETEPIVLRAETVTEIRRGAVIERPASGEPVTGPFSGQASAEFALDAEAGADLLLTFPECTAPLRVTFNGVETGDTLFPPYSVRVPAAIVRAHNTVRLTCFANAAYAFCTADLSDLTDAQIGQYHERTISFEREAVPPTVGRVKVYRA